MCQCKKKEGATPTKPPTQGITQHQAFRPTGREFCMSVSIFCAELVEHVNLAL